MSEIITASITKTQETPHATALLGRSIVTGSSSLGVAVALERGLGFLANLLAARFGGAQVFGSYSLALTTANNVASYAGAGIGTTSNRFSGQYAEGTPEHTGLVRALTLVSTQSAMIATVVLWAAAGPLATRVLLNPSLAHLLRLSSLSAGGIILLESTKGFLIGQRKFRTLLGLSAVFGAGLIVSIPAAASKGPAAMILAYACLAGASVTLCVAGMRRCKRLLDRRRGVASGPGAWDVWRFGLVQLAAFIGLNAAGWWTASLVSRSDPSMLQMGFYAAATQLRNLFAMAPGLVTQSSYALLTEERATQYGGTARVLIGCSVIATLLSIGLAGIGVATLPWTLGTVYGHAFQPAELPASLAICTGLVHMSGAPASSRLTILSLKLTGIINAIWTVLVIALTTGLIRGAPAIQATAILLVTHAISTLLVLVGLKLRAELPGELVPLSGISLAAAAVFAAVAYARTLQPAQSVPLSAFIIAVTAGLLYAGLRYGHKFALAYGGFSIRGFTVR